MKKIDNEPVYNKFFLKIKIKSDGDKATGFHDKGIPKVGSNHTCLAVISLDSALKKDGNYYPQMFLIECKYIEKKVVRHITKDIESFSSDSND